MSIWAQHKTTKQQEIIMQDKNKNAEAIGRNFSMGNPRKYLFKILLCKFKY